MLRSPAFGQSMWNAFPTQIFGLYSVQNSNNCWISEFEKNGGTIPDNNI